MTKKTYSDPIRHQICRAIKQIWTRKDETRKEVVKAARRECPKFNNDWSIDARPDVSYECAVCGDFVKEFQVDHKVPVGESPPWPPMNDGRWEKWLFDQFCIGNEDNLQVLCLGCHQFKTEREKNERNRDN